MARRRRKRRGDSISGYFKQVFAERPEWLHEKSNDVILARYREDKGMAPDAPLPKNIRQNLANVKSVLRSKGKRGGAKGPGRKRGRPAAAHTAVAVAVLPQVDNVLETLEEMIDDCLTVARNYDREGLHSVIQALRRARYEVVWKLGEA
jgi:hypothetical protein